MRDGTKIQIDDIDQAGVVVDTKMRGLRAGLEIPAEAEADVVTQISGAAKRRSYAAFPEKEQSKLLKQLRFARENDLKGVRWETNDPGLFRDVQRYRATVLTDAEQKLFRIILVER
jgi:phage protein D